MLSRHIIETLKPLVARLNAAQRLELIQWITSEAPPVEETDASAPPTKTWAARISAEAAAWHARPAADRAPYAGQYVAVLEGRVIDHDPDQRELAIRIRHQYPNTPVLITKAEARAPREYRILSPRLASAEIHDA